MSFEPKQTLVDSAANDQYELRVTDAANSTDDCKGRVPDLRCEREIARTAALSRRGHHAKNDFVLKGSYTAFSTPVAQGWQNLITTPTAPRLTDEHPSPSDRH